MFKVLKDLVSLFIGKPKGEVIVIKQTVRRAQAKSKRYFIETAHGSLTVEDYALKIFSKKGYFGIRGENNIWVRIASLLAYEQLLTEGRIDNKTYYYLNDPGCLGQLDEEEYSRFLNELAAKNISSILKRNWKKYNRLSLYFTEERKWMNKWGKSFIDFPLKIVSVLNDCQIIQIMNWIYRWKYGGYTKGFPDLVLLKDNQLSFAEVKGPTDSLNRYQIDCINFLSETVGLRVYILQFIDEKHKTTEDWLTVRDTHLRKRRIELEEAKKKKYSDDLNCLREEELLFYKRYISGIIINSKERRGFTLFRKARALYLGDASIEVNWKLKKLLKKFDGKEYLLAAHLALEYIIQSFHDCPNYFPIKYYYPLIFQCRYKAAKYRSEVIKEYNRFTRDILNVRPTDDSFLQIRYDIFYDDEKQCVSDGIWTNKYENTLLGMYIENLATLYLQENRFDELSQIVPHLLNNDKVSCFRSIIPEMYRKQNLINEGIEFLETTKEQIERSGKLTKFKRDDIEWGIMILNHAKNRKPYKPRLIKNPPIEEELLRL